MEKTTFNTTGRFWAFGGDHFYAAGGMLDFVGAFSTQEEATAAATVLRENGEGFPLYDWYQVLDAQSGRIVAHSKDQSYGA